MPPGRGESQVAAALNKTTTVPESQPRHTDESRSTNTAPSEGTYPESGKASKKKKTPSRGKTTPEKTKQVVKSNKNTSTKTTKKKPGNESKSDDDEDLISPEDEVSRETRGSATGKRTKESKSNEDEDFIPAADVVPRETRRLAAGKRTKESKSDEDEDFIPTEDVVPRETRRSAAGKRTKESKSDEDEDFIPTEEGILPRETRHSASGKHTNESKSDDDEDCFSTEDVVSRETRGSAAGKRLRSPKQKEQVNEENDVGPNEVERSLRPRNAKANGMEEAKTEDEGKGKDAGNNDSQEDDDSNASKKPSSTRKRYGGKKPRVQVHSDEEPSQYEKSRSPRKISTINKAKGKEAANNDSQDDDDTDESEKASYTRKKYGSKKQMEQVYIDEEPTQYEKSRSPRNTRTKNKSNPQYQDKKKMVLNTTSTIKRKQRDSNSNNAKQERQSHKKKQKRRSTSNDSSDDSDSDANDVKVVYEDSKATFAADFTLLEVFMRQAIHNFSPATKYKKTVMYWSIKVKTAAAHMLIERHKDEILNLIERYGGQMAMEIRFAGELRFLANNERAIQTRQIKSTYLSKQNPECRLAENIVESEMDLDQTQPPRIHKNNIGHIKSVAALRDLILSPKMYQDQVLFNIFCTGLESGNFRQNRHRPYTPLHELITKAHEAHFRVELYLALTKKSFRHHNTTSACSERVRLFNVAIASVREGREKYMKKAVETRMQNRTQTQIEDSERVTVQEDASDDNVDIDEDDL